MMFIDFIDLQNLLTLLRKNAPFCPPATLIRSPLTAPSAVCGQTFPVYTEPEPSWLSTHWFVHNSTSQPAPRARFPHGFLALNVRTSQRTTYSIVIYMPC